MIAFDEFKGHRSLKVSSVLKRALSQLFMREFYDLSGVVSITCIRVSEDIKNATVFVVIREEEARVQEIVHALNESSAVIRRAVFKYLKLRYVPRLYFKLDVDFGSFLCVTDDMLAVMKD
ncbi:30S ribosome-binding factor RbfA [Candidatus Anaplasma sp. TIGMIC]|uniref:30S ribosome-binding factor RbfA n=1 Tax=Candidatus Anaplasma sp. TIGMIC TaxID=3020713 RepID=UPI00232E0E9E|nr:30S ribosome-binding factor RbfA [Candidatus Anaplasma sp. TIGMIC]MDB1135166.1 30S ribosome-binding factor RbfA [Candidatus Anaplasma sp. TIGMIC]